MRRTSLGDDLPPQERVRLPEVVRDTVDDLETTVRHKLGQLLQRPRRANIVGRREKCHGHG